MFLNGAYQEILGDLHNLFGDTNAVHVGLTDDGYQIRHVIKGDSVSEVLRYVRVRAREHGRSGAPPGRARRQRAASSPTSRCAR